MSFKFTFVRHGNTDANNERWLQGQMDTLLNNRGLEQAALVGKRLSTEKFDKVYCSDLTRCKQTALGIMEHHPKIPVNYRTDIRERGFGSLSGQPIAHLMTESTRLGQNVDAFVKSCNGETSAEFEYRVIQAYKDILKENESNDSVSHILVVTHGGPLRVLTRYWIEIAKFTTDPVNFGKPGNHGNTAVTCITVPKQQGQGGRIELLNSTTHLGDARGPTDPPPSV
ncbi:histidine phosphatase superfamily [Fennellomyces sp. T-0311]|nr:histidine phosphatase superfamily [Fennellomyces sp. T-0311]